MYLKSQVSENGSVMLTRFSNAYKCTKIQSYLIGNCVKFLLNPLLITQTPISISLCYCFYATNSVELKFCCVVAVVLKCIQYNCENTTEFQHNRICGLSDWSQRHQ